MYYICGYSEDNIFISKSLKKTNKVSKFDNLIFNNKISSDNVFDLSIKIEYKDYKVFIIECKKGDKKSIYNFLVNRRNNINSFYKNIFIINSFAINHDRLNFMGDLIFYTIKREYPYSKFLLKILEQFLPNELIFLIIGFLASTNIVSFKIYKSRHYDIYYLNLPCILF